MSPVGERLNRASEETLGTILDLTTDDGSNSIRIVRARHFRAPLLHSASVNQLPNHLLAAVLSGQSTNVTEKQPVLAALPAIAT